MYIKKLQEKWPRLKFTAMFAKTFSHILSLTAPAWGVLLGIIGLLGFLLARKENLSLADALYCTCITAMTIGYGDIAPVTHLGRMLAVLIGLTGTIATGIIVAVAIQAVKLTYDQSDDASAGKKNG